MIVSRSETAPGSGEFMTVISPGAAECGCVPGHRMLVTTGHCPDCGLTEVEVAEHGNRPCVRGLWPRQITVDRRPVQGRERRA